MVLVEANHAADGVAGKRAVAVADKENAGPAKENAEPLKALELVFSTTVAEPCTPGAKSRPSQLATARTGRELREAAEVGQGVEVKSTKSSAFGEVTQSMSFASG